MMPPVAVPDRWSLERAGKLEQRLAAVRGCNYIPRDCVNTTQMWEDFAPQTIEQELAWAEDIGLNSVRIFLQYVVYAQDPRAFVFKMEHFLAIAERHGLSTMFVLFDDCWGPEPTLGQQPPPIPGVHNGRWISCPGANRKKREHWSHLEHYVRDLIYYFSRDERIIAWDLYNEAQPGSRELLATVFGWARALDPIQPLTACWQADDLSDVASFHCYRDTSKPAFGQDLDKALASGRPAVCTECLARTLNNRLEELLPALAQARIGWYVWGLVSGATQTRFPWGWPACGPEPYLWFHDLLYPDGRPYRQEEIDLIRRYAHVGTI